MDGGLSRDLRRTVLQAVCDHFLKEDSWPLARTLDLELGSVFDEHGGLLAVCVQIGSESILCESPNAREGRCRLRLRGLAECAGVERDIENLLAALRYCGGRYREAKAGSVTISAEEFVGELGMTEREARRTSLLLEDTYTPIWDQATAAPGGWHTFRLCPFSRKVSGVGSLDELLQRVGAEEENRRIASLAGAVGSADQTAAPFKIFLSHAAADRPLADLVRTFLSGHHVFMASKPGDIRPGEEWLGAVQTELRHADAYLVLLTPNSVERPWVWFETGAAWMSERNLVLVTAGGLSVGEVPYPMAAFQVLSLENSEEAAAVFRHLGAPLSSPDAFSSAVQKAGCDAIDVGSREAGWLGVHVGLRFFAWDGPIHGLEDRNACFSAAGLEAEIVRAGMRPYHSLRGKLPKHLSEGWLQVYETDRRRWRREVLGNNESVLIVRRA